LPARKREKQEDEMVDLEAFRIEFTKLIQILEVVDINKEVDVDVDIDGNLAMADAKGIAEADALGLNTVTETLTLATTSTHAVQFVGSSSDSSVISQSLSAATLF
jgi:hypothetical protein